MVGPRDGLFATLQFLLQTCSSFVLETVEAVETGSRQFKDVARKEPVHGVVGHLPSKRGELHLLQVTSSSELHTGQSCSS